MNDFIKKHGGKLLLLLIVLIILFPILLNSIVTIESPVKNIAGEPKDWILFWGSYVSGLASFAMVFIAWWTLRQSKKQNDAVLAQNMEQLNELKRQWEESTKPILMLKIVTKESTFFLKISNLGSISNANIDFISVCEKLKENFSKLCEVMKNWERMILSKKVILYFHQKGKKLFELAFLNELMPFNELMFIVSCNNESIDYITSREFKQTK